mgnify:CR=1 FL=1|tara:strand:+ start:6759 stop:7418 length:660 start_codon:yes stop_codon:yes gene_type:complete
MNKLFIFSGIDGSGKSTQIEIIAENLKYKGLKVATIWARGGYTPGFIFLKSCFRFLFGKNSIPSGYSQKRKKILKNNFLSKIWINIAIIDLIVYWAFYLRLKLLFVDVIICDRYIFDTYIDFKINFPYIEIDKFLFWKILLKSFLKPDLSILLMISFDESQRRLLKKIEPYPESYEKAFSRYSLYLKLHDIYLYKKINSEGNLKEVSNQINNEVNKKIF